MKFADALEIILHGGRCQRMAWRSHPTYGLGVERAGSGTYLALGYGDRLGSVTVWRTAPIDVLKDDWQECEIIAAQPRAYKDD